MKSGLHHIALNVTDVKTAAEFYSSHFGFVEIPKPHARAGAWLQADDGRQIHLRKGEVPEDKGQHLALLVEDINQAYKSLTAAGVAVTSPRPIGSSLQSFLHDPAGNRLEIHQLG
ncbi:MAG: VOC family protein [Actinomycetota bacterium]|nr:VOC family protein [Actinomycetota bacterium]MEC8974370.1 VOC family protein [Actinomycetota bacterium]